MSVVDTLSSLWSGYKAVKDAIKGVKTNRETCEELQQHVERIFENVGALPKEISEDGRVSEEITNLLSIFDDCAVLVRKFQLKSTAKETLSHEAIRQKFKIIHKRLDRAFSRLTFAVEVSSFSFSPLLSFFFLGEELTSVAFAQTMCISQPSLFAH